MAGRTFNVSSDRPGTRAPARSPVSDDAAIVAIERRIIALEIDYWFNVDHHWGRNAQEFYVPDGLFAIGDSSMKGRKAVQEFYSWRESRGARVARHVVSNLRVRVHDSQSARLDCILHLYAADGAPILESRAAIMVADIESECVLADGQWLFARHLVKPLFVGGEGATLPPVSNLVPRK